MTPMRGRLSSAHLFLWVTLIITTVFVLAVTPVALARVDAFGGASFTAPYAPYTAGPAVRMTAVEPYAPYTAGPVVRETALPYAPYTAGPVVKETTTPMNIGHYMLK